MGAQCMCMAVQYAAGVCMVECPVVAFMGQLQSRLRVRVEGLGVRGAVGAHLMRSKVVAGLLPGMHHRQQPARFSMFCRSDVGSGYDALLGCSGPEQCFEVSRALEQ